PACPGPAPRGAARCFAQVRTDAAARSSQPVPAGQKANPLVLGNSGAYDPSYLQSAYNLAAAAVSAGAARTVAIVDAYDASNAASDLAYYRSYFGLGPMNGLPNQPSCTLTPVASGPQPCFQKVNQGGGTSYPPPNSGWAQEIS